MFGVAVTDPVTFCFSVSSVLCQKYSEKEDKYEEEIKVLTDKLKEVRFPILPISLFDHVPCVLRRGNE